MIDTGQPLLPEFAPWLGKFKTELLGFPKSKHDDQVDALSQLLAHVRDRDRFRDTGGISAPIYGSDLLQPRWQRFS